MSKASTSGRADTAKRGAAKGGTKGAATKGAATAGAVKAATKSPPPKKVAMAAAKGAAKGPAKGAAKGAAKGTAKGAAANVHELMVYAYAMEAEAAERYAEFADAMETHNNPAVAELFRKMARIESLHAQQIRDRMGWHDAPAPAGGAYRWEGMEAPETADHGDLHYLMTPHHALKIARVNEERARQFYAKLARQADDDETRAAALEMCEEEAEHVRLIDEWLARTPAPEKGWAVDLDPPNYNE